MLILTRKPGESLYIGDSVKVTVVEIKGNQIRVGIDAPPELRIYREEIYLQILEENRKASETEISGAALDQLSGSWKGMTRGGAGEKKDARPTSKPQVMSPSQLEPRVFVKRKKRRDGGDDEDVPPEDGGGQGE
jgi:carbon storage regulator